MDWGSISGIVIALLALLLGQAAEGGHIGSLLQPAAFLVVFFGTLGAVLLQTKPNNFVLGMRMLPLIFKPIVDDRLSLIKKINRWSYIARKDGLLALEPQLQIEKDHFVKQALRLMIDGIAPEKIREICSIDMYYYEQKQRQAAKIWEAAGGYSPTLGILGAVLGLIHVMENLSDPSKLGSGIAVAFVATIYGVGLANLFFLPIGNKLKNLINHEMMRREMILNACVSIAKGDHPKIVEERLYTYMH
ncbi:MAG: flagellar motor protein [Methylophilaceae bacterium]|nr:flagellar motor protein [Methylophilaceae bacterium]